MIRKKLTAIIDFDDVLAYCNEYACEIHKCTTGEALNYNSITDWGYLNKPVDARLQYFRYKEFYENQKAYPGADEFLITLMTRADVFICTSVRPEFMGIRVESILKLFPFFPQENILMGGRKDMVHADIMLDDRIKNLRHASIRFPVLFRRPWNRHISGIASVTNYKEFLAILDTLSGDVKPITKLPKVICIMGPSGSGKNHMANTLNLLKGYERVKTYSNARQNGEYIRLYNDPHIHEQEFFESSYYCGTFFASSMDSIKKCLAGGKHAVMVLDITGCMAMRAAFPGQTLICYKKASRKECIKNTLIKRGLNIDQITDRIANMEYEEKNEVIADLVILGDDLEDLGKLTAMI